MGNALNSVFNLANYSRKPNFCFGREIYLFLYFGLWNPYL